MYEKENDLKMIGDSNKINNNNNNNNNNENNDDGILMIEGSDNKTGEIASWKYKVKNTLMFYPEGENQIPEDNPRRAPKQIVHSATRFESQDEITIYNHAAATAAAATVSGTNIDSTSESDTPRVGGYGFVSATPSPSPSQFDSSELMTWGVIEGSPQLLGGDQTPGRTFQLPPTPRREIIGMNLSSTASRNIRKRNLSLKSPSISSPSPLSRMASPRVRAALLSPAARKLLRKSNLTPRGSRASGNVDSQLRDFYNSSSNTTMTSPSTPTSKYVTKKMESVINNNNNHHHHNTNNHHHHNNNNNDNNNNPRPIKINENEK
ncbi:hypothetical protein Glove_243g44 [Diversispora epigaea]|uniref:Uncharacterized protein n=1 Tax=Diversispora epigaea TaxID=1348612 RepID=A0A397IBD2_9GLOM|nr:hypothetical protein Glove_243g44 [Diversispora epigaea]